MSYRLLEADFGAQKRTTHGCALQVLDNLVDEVSAVRKVLTIVQMLDFGVFLKDLFDPGFSVAVNCQFVVLRRRLWFAFV